MGEFADLIVSYPGRLVRDLDEGDVENQFTSDWQWQHYFDIGCDALRIVLQALLAAGHGAPASILDYPSGSGRVTRHLAAMFPDAAITAADLYESHVEFCERTFNATGIVTPAEVSTFNFPDRFDLIFCGSLMTHLPRRLAKAVLALIARSLSPRGIAVVTTHGRRSDFLQRNRFQYLSNRRYRVAQLLAEAFGYGFVNYHTRFRTKRFFKQSTCGIALTRPSWTMHQVLRLPDVRVLGYAEMLWDVHQDVVVFGRPGVDAD